MIVLHMGRKVEGGKTADGRGKLAGALKNISKWFSSKKLYNLPVLYLHGYIN